MRRLLTIPLVLANLLTASAAVPDGRVILTRVRVVGAVSVPRREVDQVLEITAGEVLDRVKVVRTAKSLQALFRGRGFERVSIESKLTRQAKGGETVLEFLVEEGIPTRVASVEFQLQGETSRKEVLSQWEVVKRRLELAYGFTPGMVFDQTRMADLKLNLQELLTSLNYVGTKIFDPEMSAAEAPDTTPANRWVAVRYRVELGDRVSFGFRGNESITRGQLDEVVAEQRTIGLGVDYEQALSSRIRELYRSQGYAQTKISSYSYDTKSARERHVTFVIEEGPRVRLTDVTFDGNQAFSSDELKRQFFALSSDLTQNGTYSEKDVARAADALVDWMRAQGYLSARLLTSRTTFPGLPKKMAPGSQAQVLLYVFEGDQTIAQELRVSGATVLSQEKIADFLQFKAGQPLNLYALNSGLDQIKSAYRDLGYLGVAIENEGTPTLVQYSLDHRVAQIDLRIVQGPQYRVSEIAVEGLEFTSEEVIRRELDFVVGDVLEEHMVQEARTRLTRLGIFSTVDIRVQDDFEYSDRKRVRLLIEEAGRFILEAGPGFRSDFGVRAFATGTYANVWGRNHTASVNLSTNARVQNYRFIEYQLRANYLWPWIFLGQTNLKVTGSLERWQYFNFNADSVNLVAGLDRRLFKQVPLTAQLSYSLEGVTQSGSLVAQDNQAFRIGTLAGGLKLDLLDNTLSPTSGAYASAVFEWASPYLLAQEDINYTRFNFKSDYYIPLFSKRSVIALSVRAGVERNAATNGYIPLLKQYSLGGVYTIRGLQEQQVNIQNIELGGIATYVNYRLQWDLPVGGQFRIGPFLDAGNLIVTGTNSPLTTSARTGSASILGTDIALDAPITLSRFLFGEMIVAAGLAFSYVTPIGPLSLSVGYGLNAALPTSRIDISFGRI